jgi:hypothetical protein
MTTDTPDMPELPEPIKRGTGKLADETTAVVRGQFQHYYDVMGMTEDDRRIMTVVEAKAYARSYGAACMEAGAKLERERLSEAHVLLDSLANHHLSRNNLEQLAAEWVEQYDAAIRKEPL